MQCLTDHPPSPEQNHSAGQGAWHVWPIGQGHPPLVPVISQKQRMFP